LLGTGVEEDVGILAQGMPEKRQLSFTGTDLAQTKRLKANCHKPLIQWSG